MFLLTIVKQPGDSALVHIPKNTTLLNFANTMINDHVDENLNGNDSDIWWIIMAENNMNINIDDFPAILSKETKWLWRS